MRTLGPRKFQRSGPGKIQPEIDLPPPPLYRFVDSKGLTQEPPTGLKKTKHLQAPKKRKTHLFCRKTVVSCRKTANFLDEFRNAIEASSAVHWEARNKGLFALPARRRCSYSFSVTVILRASPPVEVIAISPIAFLRMLLNFSPHSTSTSASGVSSSSRPSDSSCRSPSSL